MNTTKTGPANLWCCVHRSMQSKRMTRADIAAMLREYQATHLQNEITGACLQIEDQFVHYLEGPSLALMSTIERLLQDPRLMATEELYREPIAQRLFAHAPLDFHDLGLRSSQFGVLEPDLLHRVLADAPPPDGRGHEGDVFHRLWVEYAASRSSQPRAF